MLRITLCAAALIALTAAPAANGHDVVIQVKKTGAVESPSKPPFTGTRPAVDVAILLDTSNSMDGLISQAKQQLWTIVQQFAKAKKAGQTPVLRVALFEYGNTGLPAAEGYIRQVVPLCDDLDKLSESLFALRTNGGDEYCGQVIKEAIRRLDWSKEPGSYQAIFIAGNEPFTQGSIDYRDSCRAAIERGIVVNTIHCGDHRQGVNGKWQHGARLAEGEFFNIDQDRAVVHIKCPQDEVIIRLNAELNRTYLWYGSDDKRAYYGRNQLAQDSNAAAASEGVAVARAVTKAGKMYSNRNRDLVDSLESDHDLLLKVKVAELPEAMREMNLEQRKAHIKKMAAKRAELQKQINKLGAERDAFVAQERKRLAQAAGESTLGDAVVTAIQKQLIDSGFDTGAANP